MWSTLDQIIVGYTSPAMSIFAKCRVPLPKKYNQRHYAPCCMFIQIHTVWCKRTKRAASEFFCYFHILKSKLRTFQRDMLSNAAWSHWPHSLVLNGGLPQKSHHQSINAMDGHYSILSHWLVVNYRIDPHALGGYRHVRLIATTNRNDIVPCQVDTLQVCGENSLIFWSNDIDFQFWSG